MTPGLTVRGLFHFARPAEVHSDGELGRPTPLRIGKLAKPKDGPHQLAKINNWGCNNRKHPSLMSGEPLNFKISLPNIRGGNKISKLRVFLPEFLK